MDWMPTPLRSVHRLLQVLQEESTEAGNGLTGSPMDLYSSYLQWTTKAIRLLRPYLGPEDLDRLVTTRDYWSLRGTDPGQLGHQLAPLVLAERQHARDALSAADTALRRAVAVWGRTARIVVPDTNVYLQHHQPVELIDWHSLLGLGACVNVLVGVPLLVVDELDGQKQAMRKAQARHSLKRLAPLLDHPDCDLQLWQRLLAGAGSVTFRLYADHPTHRRLNRADDEICAQAQTLGVLGEQLGLPTPPVVVVTMDSGMVGRANLAGLRGLLLERPEDPWKVTDHPWPAPNAPSRAMSPD